MWADVETSQDFLNFRVMAGLVAQMILDANGKPLSIGISGGWGVGKSSMVKLIEEELIAVKNDKIVYMTFNAWLYQGHDDAKAALMEEISRKLITRAKNNGTLVARAWELASRVNWFRLGRLGAEFLASLHLGVPVSPLTKGAESIYGHLTDGHVAADAVEGVETFAKEHKEEIETFAKTHKSDAKGLIKPKKAPETPPQMIHALRAQFESLLKDLDITLVVFVDDLDRCLPPTVIGTLEAMRLFLFMERTAFVIAADEKMIKEAVRIHFAGASLDDDLVVSYFDKLIQVPLRVPPLGINEARAYLMLLFSENSELPPETKEKVRSAVNTRLAQSWKGESVSVDFVEGEIPNCPQLLKGEFAVADRLAKQMVSSRRIAGNPRLIKRFLNTLSIRKKLATIYKIGVDDSILAKVLLFERCATRAAFELLVELVNNVIDGKPVKMRALEKAAREGADIPFEGFDAWKADHAFVSEWLTLDPALADVDLRGALHVGRESLPIVSDDERVSKAATEIAKEMMALRLKGSDGLKGRFVKLVPDERKYVMDKLLERAAVESSWGTPDILWGLSLAADADADAAKRLIGFLCHRQTSALNPPIVVRIRGAEWGKEVTEEWAQRPNLPSPLKKVLDLRPKETR
jgi:predicted KAP-like P-loop ATPase